MHVADGPGVHRCLSLLACVYLRVHGDSHIAFPSVLWYRGSGIYLTPRACGFFVVTSVAAGSILAQMSGSSVTLWNVGVHRLPPASRPQVLSAVCPSLSHCVPPRDAIVSVLLTSGPVSWHSHRGPPSAVFSVPGSHLGALVTPLCWPHCCVVWPREHTSLFPFLCWWPFGLPKWAPFNKSPERSWCACACLCLGCGSGMAGSR